VEKKSAFEGTVSDLLTEMKTPYIGSRVPLDYPKTLRGVSEKLKRSAQALRTAGITFKFGKRSAKGREVIIEYANKHKDKEEGNLNVHMT